MNRLLVNHCQGRGGGARIAGGTTSPLCLPLRSTHMPGWKTTSSTRDIRSREKREEDRKLRQIEKLPKPEALHDYQYPYEKTVLSDQMFQVPVFENELDTPELFHSTPPPDFFLYWNHASFERTSYPLAPEVDHRALVPNDKDLAWARHRMLMNKYLKKHEIVPSFIPHVAHTVNMSVVYNGTFDRRLRRDPDDQSVALPPRGPVEELDKRNFWFTAHAGNFIELFETQEAPSVFLSGAEGQQEEEKELFTLMIASPDYPYATASNINSAGFFLNYVVSNLSAASGAAKQPSHGDVVVPYVHPLPTEDGGTVRVMCMLFKQKSRVEGIRPLSLQEARSAFPHPARSQYRLHQYSTNAELAAAVPTFFKLPAVERSLADHNPSALTHFRTSWDIQVQEYYESLDLPEPAYQVGEELEAILAFNARSSSSLRVNARHTADGAKNPGDDPTFWYQPEPTRTRDGTMANLWSRRTSLGMNGQRIVTPHRKP